MDSLFVLFLFNGLFSSFIYMSVASEDNVTTVEYGQTAELICPLSQDIAKTFWTGPPDETIYNFPSSIDIIQTVPNADRLSINASNAGLLIHNVTLQDQGIYKCTAVLSNDTEITELRLEVTNVPPSSIAVENTEKHDSRDVIHGREDGMLTLTCSADGAKPEPNITWARSDTNDTFNANVSTHRHSNGTFAVSSSIEIVTDRSLDGTVFHCTVRHQTLELPVENNVEIFLDLKPQMEQMEDPTIAIEGFNVTFSCEVYGSRPAANISLYLNGEEQSGLDENIVVRNETSDTYRTTTMFHRIMDRQDDGKMVKCAIHHSTLEYTINKTWIVVVHYPPSVVVSGQNVTSFAESLSIDCLASNGNPNNYTFSSWQHRWNEQTNILREIESTNIENNKATLKLENLTFQDSGYYKCYVSNGIGIPVDHDYLATDEVFLFMKDIPYVVEGHTEYLTGIDESIEVVLDVYTNVEPIHVSITTKTDAWETTAVWTIKDNIRKTVGIPVYNQKILISGFRITADFEVQAEKNYGDYKIVIRNEIGSTSHYFKVLPRAVVTTGAPSVKVDDTNVVAIVVGVVVPVVVIAAVAVAIIVYCRKTKKPTERPPLPAGKRFIPKETGNLYDYINPKGDGYINPMGEGKSTDKQIDAKDDGYLQPQSPKVVAEQWEYTKGDEKVVYKRVEARGMDQIDSCMNSSLKMPSLTMSAAHQPDAAQYENEGRSSPTNFRSLSIEEMPEMSEGYVTMSGNSDQTNPMEQSTPDIEEVD